MSNPISKYFMGSTNTCYHVIEVGCIYKKNGIPYVVIMPYVMSILLHNLMKVNQKHRFFQMH